MQHKLRKQDTFIAVLLIFLFVLSAPIALPVYFFLRWRRRKRLLHQLTALGKRFFVATDGDLLWQTFIQQELFKNFGTQVYVFQTAHFDRRKKQLTFEEQFFLEFLHQNASVLVVQTGRDPQLFLFQKAVKDAHRGNRANFDTQCNALRTALAALTVPRT